ncbi:MAG: HD domain-containing protein [Eubacteriales bacterium]|nr:HD domain-containing protein [Eubacteriales bacterium]MDD4133960.1 HD domain-containing protein [Eubacteriales bacterium]
MNQTAVNKFSKDERFEGYLLVRNAEKRLNKNNEPYLDITLADNTGDINAKVWNCDDEPPTSGTVLKVRGSVTEYNKRLQFKIERYRMAESQDEVDLSALVAAAPRASDEMFNEILAVIEGMQNPVVKAITGEMVRRAGDKLHYYPAAQSMHHAERSGLLHHLTDMIRVAQAILPCYPFLDGDLLLAGIVLHDLGKLTEMLSDTLGNVSEYSKEGLLLGHLVTGVAEVRDAAKALGYPPDEEYALLLEHMIISHHGLPEYGSPRKPQFPEAEVLSQLDDLDAKLNEMQAALKRTRPGEFSDRVFALDRRVYHPRYLDEEDAFSDLEELNTGLYEGESGLDPDSAYQGLL